MFRKRRKYKQTIHHIFLKVYTITKRRSHRHKNIHDIDNELSAPGISKLFFLGLITRDRVRQTLIAILLEYVLKLCNV
jgi:hypothetical protein